MEGKSEEIVEAAQAYCLGCLCSPDEYKLHDYKIQYPHFWAIFEENSLKLCYVCRRLAQRAESFIQNVQTNQILLQNCLGDAAGAVRAARARLRPAVALRRAPAPGEPLGGAAGPRAEPEELPQDDTVKLELKLEETLHESDGSLDGNNGFPESCVKDEEDDFPLLLLKKEMEQENASARRGRVRGARGSKPRRRGRPAGGEPAADTQLSARKAKELEHNAALGIRRLELSAEQLAEERRRAAASGAFLACALRCQDCLKGFNDRAAFERHMLRHAPEAGPAQCPVCKLRMESADKLASHAKCHTVRFECMECGLVRTSRSTLLDHARAAHRAGAAFPCPHCHKTFARQMSQRKHIRYTHVETARVTCAYCHKSYANKEVIKSHIMAQHAEQAQAARPARRHACAECGARFQSPTHLRMHAYKHTRRRDFYCVECDKAFKSEAVLKQHLKTAQPHVSYADLPLSCSRCPKRFAIRRDLERHENSVHLDRKPFRCDRCDKAYVSSWSLRDHARHAHEGYKRPLRYPCKLCDKVFDRSSILKAHVRTHTGERPYACARCPAAFTQAGVLATHLRLIHQRLTRQGRPRAPPRA